MCGWLFAQRDMSQSNRGRIVRAVFAYSPRGAVGQSISDPPFFVSAGSDLPGASDVIACGHTCRGMLRNARQKLMYGCYGLLFVALCWSTVSSLAGQVPSGCLAVRATEETDIANAETKRVVHALITFACRIRIRVHD